MDNGSKSKLAGWSATVGLAALALLGNVGEGQTGNNSAGVTTKSAPANDSSAVVTGPNESYQISQSSPPRPPPRPPAVGAVRG